jgi:peroxiredoxin
VISNDDATNSQKTQADVPHLKVVTDADQALAKKVEMLHRGAGQYGDDTNAPTTFVLDGAGTVKWWSRSGHVLDRPSPDEVLKAIDQIGTAKK